MSPNQSGSDLPGWALQAGSTRSGLVVLIVAVLVTGGLLAQQFLLKPQEPESVAPTTSVERNEPAAPVASSPPARQATTPSPLQREAPPGIAEVATTAPLPAAATQPLRGDLTPSAADVAQAQTLVKLLAEFKDKKDKLTATDIQAITDAIEELKRLGSAGVMAIAQYLQSGEDINFAKLNGGAALPYSTLRLALLETLTQIGGRDAAEAMVQALPATANAQEIAVLAKGLEKYAPKAYRQEIADAAQRALTLALKRDPAAAGGDLAYLFGVMQDFGDTAMAATLEEVYRTTNNAWTEYSLMALSKLPEGQGVPVLADLANEMADDPSRNPTRYAMSLRMLAQASRENPEAGDTLIQLAQAGKLTTTELTAVAAPLGGTEYQLITPSSRLAQISKAPVSLSSRVAETWTDHQIDERLALIDRLLAYTPEPAAAQALNEARNRLQVWKSRPMVNGRRIKQ